MGFPTYTDEQRAQIREFIQSSTITLEDVENDTRDLHDAFFRLHENTIKIFNAKGVPTTEDGWFETMMRSGALRDGTGEKLPANWGIEDLLLYMQDKSAQLEQLKQTDRKQYEQEKNRMFLLCAYNPETKEYEGDYQGINIDNFFNAKKDAVGYYSGNMTLTDTVISKTEVELDSEKIAIAEEEVAQAKAKAARNNQTAEIQSTFVDAIRTLRKDLRRMDSIFSSDSREYVNFKTALDDLYHRLDQNEFRTPEEFYNAFSAKDEVTGKSVLDFAADYENAKRAKHDSLSDRQMGRMSICSRLHAIDKELQSATAKEHPTAIADSRKNLRLDAAANKAMLGSLKHIGNRAARDIYKKGEQKYAQQLAIVKAALAGKDEATLSALEAETSSTKVAEKLTPGTIKKDKAFKREHDEASAALARLNKDQVPMTMVAQYLLDRSSAMLDELEAAENFSHSDEYLAFRSSIAGLHRSIAGIAADPNGFGPEKLANALGEAVNAANLYQIRHKGDKLNTYEPNVTRRLGQAAELKICKDFLDNYRNTLIEGPTQDVTELFQRLSVHQDKMRELELESKYLGSLQLGDRLSTARGGKRIQGDKFYNDMQNKLGQLAASNYPRKIQTETKEFFKDAALNAKEKTALLERVSKNRAPGIKDYIASMKEFKARQLELDGKYPAILGEKSYLEEHLHANAKALNSDVARGGLTTHVISSMMRDGYSFDEIMEKDMLTDQKKEYIASTMELIGNVREDNNNGEIAAKNLLFGMEKIKDYINLKLSNLKEVSVPELAKPQNKNLLAAMKMLLNMKQEFERKPTVKNPNRDKMYSVFVKNEDDIKKIEDLNSAQIDLGTFSNLLENVAEQYVKYNQEDITLIDISQASFLGVPIAKHLLSGVRDNGPTGGKNFIEDFQALSDTHPDIYRGLQNINNISSVSLDSFKADFCIHPQELRCIANSVFHGEGKFDIEVNEDGRPNVEKYAKSFNKFAEKTLARGKNMEKIEAPAENKAANNQKSETKADKKVKSSDNTMNLI